MKNIIKLVTIALLSSIVAVGVESCGKDDPEEAVSKYEESDFWGYWADSSEQVVFHFSNNAELTAYTLNEAGSSEYTERYNGTWNYSDQDNEIIISFKEGYPNSPFNSYSSNAILKVVKMSENVIVCRDLDGNVISLTSRAGGLHSAGNSPDMPDNPDVNESDINKSDFYGIWLNWTKSGYFVFETNGSATYYWLTATNSDKLSGDSDTGKWMFDSATSVLSIYDFKVLGDKKWKVTEMSETCFESEDGRWQRAASLPDVESGNQFCDDTRICGTWKGKDYDDIYSLTFDESGNLTEVWNNGSDSETIKTKYKFRNGKLTFEGDEPSVAGVIGNSPFIVTFSSGSKPSTMTISDPSLDSMKFTRQ